MIYVTSDWHLYHDSILAFTPRPWDNVEEMSAEIVERTRNKLSKGDTLYFLGDLYFKIGTHRQDVTELMRSLIDEGINVHAILGNHDEPKRWGQPLYSLFSSVTYATEVFEPARKGVRSRRIFLSHYPLAMPKRDDLRLLSLHGHSHGTIASLPGRIDVGVDAIAGYIPDYDYTPITLEEAIALADQDLPAVHEPQDERPLS